MFLPPPTSQQTTEKSTINLWKKLTLSTKSGRTLFSNERGSINRRNQLKGKSLEEYITALYYQSDCVFLNQHTSLLTASCKMENLK